MTSPTTVASFTVVLFSAWYLSFTGIVVRFRIVINNVVNPQPGDSELEQTADIIARTSPDLMDLLRIATIQYGDEVLVYGFALVFIASTTLVWWRTDTVPDVLVVFFGTAVLLFASSAVFFLSFDLIGGFGRPLSFGKLFAVPLAGAFWYLAWQVSGSSETQAAVALSLGVVLLTIVCLSVFSMFHSPAVAQSNPQVTQMEIDGTEWTFENRNEDLLIDEFGIRQYRFHHLHRGVEATSPGISRHATRPPDHFNYTTHETLGESYAEDRYFLLTEQGRTTYPTRFPEYREQWRYTPEDFDRLQNDESVAQVYSNGDYTAYRITGTASST